MASSCSVSFLSSLVSRCARRLANSRFGAEQIAQFHEGGHDLDVGSAGAFTVEHGRQHGYAPLGEHSMGRAEPVTCSASKATPHVDQGVKPRSAPARRASSAHSTLTNRPAKEKLASGVKNHGRPACYRLDRSDPCTKACTLAHEMSHVVTAQLKFGDVCRNKPPGYDPSFYRNWVNGWDATFQRASECQAYRVEDSCLEKKEGDCACKKAAHARRYGG